MFLQRCAESGVLLRSGAFLSFGKAFPGGADTGEGGVGLLDKLTGEIDGVPVLGGEQEQADGLKVEFLSYVPHQAEVAKGLGHLLIIYIYIAVMHPVPCEGLACGRLALGYLVFVMGEYKILATCVNVKGGAQQLHTHGAALYMPARTAFAPGAVPCGLAGLGALPEGEVQRIPLQVSRLYARAGLKIVYGLA